MKRYSTIMSVLLTLALPVAGSCADAPKVADKGETPVKAADAAAAQKEKATVEEIQKSMSKSGHGAMMGTATGADGAQLNPSGKVVETMDGGGYTYANLEKDGKKTWVAFPTLETRVGDNLSFRGCMEMPNFQSKSLNRKFDSILFCGSPEVSQASAKAAAVTSPGSQGSVTSAAKNIKVEKATGANAYTIAEVYAKAASLNGKQVVVRGQVVKSSSGIMNRNWLHLQDGTGSEKKKNHDLVVTTGDTAEVGDVVTVSGTLAKDKDFGSGYKYHVIIEKATVKK